jgi:tetratricopeptide (TPR) repeat protein
MEETMQDAIALADGELRSDSWFNLGNTYFVQQQWEQAVEAYKEALRIDPSDAEAKYNLELALLQIGQEEPELTPTPEEEENPPTEEEQSPEEQTPEEDQNNEQEQSGGDQGTPTPTAESADSDEQSAENSDQGEGGQAEATATPEPTEPEPSDPQSQGQGGELTQEQAEQLLEAVGQGTQTLQERLQQIYVVPGGPPSKDY